MHAPICTVCLGSGILCSACNARLERGEITQGDVEVSRFLHERTRDVKSLKDVTVKRVVEAGSVLLVVCGKGDAAKIVGRGGAVVDALSRRFKKKVRVAEESGDEREFIRNMLLPAAVKGVNILYTPAGEEYVVHVAKGSRLPMDEKTLDEICRKTVKNGVRIVLE